MCGQNSVLSGKREREHRFHVCLPFGPDGDIGGSEAADSGVVLPRDVGARWRLENPCAVCHGKPGRGSEPGLQKGMSGPGMSFSSFR